LAVAQYFENKKAVLWKCFNGKIWPKKDWQQGLNYDKWLKNAWKPGSWKLEGLGA